MKNNKKSSSKGTTGPPGNGPDLDLVPPDGGWGWMIIFANGLSSIIVIPVLQCFGLLFQKRFSAIGMSGTDASVIININSAFGMILGLFNGYILRTFGYRKIAVAGGLLYSGGVMLTSFAYSFLHFVITYGVITSLGLNMLTSSFNLALNSYFKERRSKAVGYTMTVIGLGPVLVPLLISALMHNYGVEGTSLILGALCLHSLVGASLLRPIKWYMKPRPVPLLEVEDDDAEDINKSDIDKEKGFCEHEGSTTRKRQITVSSDHDFDSQSMYGFETPVVEHKAFNAKRRLSTSSSYKRSTSHIDEKSKTTVTPKSGSRDHLHWWASAETVNLGSSVKIFDEKSYQPLVEDKATPGESKSIVSDEKTTSTLLDSNGAVGCTKEKNGDVKLSTVEDKEVDKDEEEEPKKTFWQRLGVSIVAFFDLGLLTDPVYVNLMIGMSLAICGEYNFSLLTPFILNDRGFATDRIAVIMSIIAVLDIIFRFMSPYFSDYYKISARSMYIISLLMLISSRTTLIFCRTFKSVLTVAVALGVAKGVRSVYMTLVIPNYVPIDRLASASGIQMVTNGILLMAFGPLIGYIRDVSGSYDWCIASINMLTAVTVTMWTTEYVICYCREKKRLKEEEKEEI